MIQSIYDSPRETCRAVLELYKSPGGKKSLFAIQYNRFMSQNTTWWLSPKGVSPAYKFGKFCFVPHSDVRCVPSVEGGIVAGLYVEKGLGRDSLKPRPQIMDSSWYWHSFSKELVTSRFSSALNTIQTESRVAPIVYIDSIIESQKDSICFQWESRTEGLVPIGQDFMGTSLSDLIRVSNLRGLAESLNALTGNPFVWIDFMVGIRMGLHGDGEKCWDAWSIHKNLLQHLEPWVR